MGHLNAKYGRGPISNIFSVSRDILNDVLKTPQYRGVYLNLLRDQAAIVRCNGWEREKPSGKEYWKSNLFLAFKIVVCLVILGRVALWAWDMAEEDTDEGDLSHHTRLRLKELQDNLENTFKILVGGFLAWKCDTTRAFVYSTLGASFSGIWTYPELSFFDVFIFGAAGWVLMVDGYAGLPKQTKDEYQ